MKTINILSKLSLSLLLTLFLISCTADDKTNKSQKQDEIENTVQSGQWIVQRFIDSGNNETADFACYSFSFNDNGTLTASYGANTITGSWNISNSNSNDDSSDDLDFNIIFTQGNLWDELVDDWEIVSYTSSSIVLVDISGGNGGIDSLYFALGVPSTNCSSGNNGIQQSIEDNLANGDWYISLFEDSGVDETQYFTNYSFTFNNNGSLEASSNANNYSGTWSISDSNSSDDSIDDLDFNILFTVNNTFEDLSDDWDIVSQTATKIELISISGGNGGTDYLTFEKN